MDKKFLFIIWMTCWLSIVSCQSNRAANIAANLMMCYNVSAIPGITIPNQRPPVYLNLLIEYIRKIEDANPTMNARQLSYHILQSLRQDGIAQAERVSDISFIGLPYSASRPERYKFWALLKNLIPDAEATLSMGDLSNIETCALHYMISNTIDNTRRDNETTDCSRSARYTSRITLADRRRRRDVGVREDVEDMELISPIYSSRLQASSLNVSQCPIELGVMYSEFGTVKVGNVLAGIAAGLNQQTLLNGLVDNRYAATIVGELCEAALYQARTNISLGAAGGWNSTISPKYFFLENNNNLQATDAELRGALDGLAIALMMSNLTSTFTNLKISQIFDMYYSVYEKGIFDESLKACNRSDYYSQVTTTEDIRQQLHNFMPILNEAALSQGTIPDSELEILSNASMNAFTSYLPRMISTDLTCTGVSSIARVAADLQIFIDSSWQYSTVQAVLSYVLNNIDVNKFQTRYTVYGGTSVRNLTSNGTRYLSDFFVNYNESTHANEVTGFDYVKVFETVENYGYSKLNNNSYSGGESTIVLLVTKTGLTEEQKTFLTQRKSVFNQFLPDVSFIVLGTGAASDYETIVSNTNRDVIILQETDNEETLKNTAADVVNVIKEIPRAVINPTCTATYTGSASTFSLTDYVEKSKGKNYYRISPNYFYNGGDSRKLTIKEEGYGSIIVCTSRENSRQTIDNSTSNCTTLSSAGFSVDISNYCSGSSASTCSPIYIAVFGRNSGVRCTDNLCRFPDDIKYSITMENVGCAESGSQTLQMPLTLVISVMFFIVFKS
ncbi:uncharacterized protein LOC126748394 [Anthonomus grandis grandis]|uniref:uncharacterized protein LOC126748394 n=1 Tax=Anthonomus grandis grandis TaxID=2921223 RepID=UPI002166293E|nr:uncharacterized protein LOC126748394 [Anthonomus grandis grandis]